MTGSAGRSPAVYGHRGNRRPGPDNSVLAVLDALARGADGVEIDVRRRPAGPAGPGSGARTASVGVKQPGLTGVPEAAGRLRLAVGHDPLRGGEPALCDILDAARGHRVICEIKNRPGARDYDGGTAATAALLVPMLAARGDDAGSRTAGPVRADDIVISSFDADSLRAVRALSGPPVALLSPFGVPVRRALALAVALGAAELHPHWRNVTAEGVARAHDAGLRVVAWTVRSPRRARLLAATGVDGVICDDPARIRASYALAPGPLFADGSGRVGGGQDPQRPWDRAQVHLLGRS